MRPSLTWQTILADLSLILFMVTASALSDPSATPASGGKPIAPLSASARAKPMTASPAGEPVGVWREGPSIPALSQWVAQEARDSRLRATVLVRQDGDTGRALEHARNLLLQLGPLGPRARLVVEPSGREGAGATVTLSYDADPMAR